MGDLEFLTQTSRREKLKTFVAVWAIIVVLVIIGVLFTKYWYPIVQYLPFVSIFAETIKNDITQATPLGILYAHFIGGDIFIPSPDEVIFYYALVKENNVMVTLGTAMGGYLLAQALNYVLGLKLSKPVLALISKEKVYRTRRLTNKYGAWSVFFANVAPLPAPLLTFALGIARYNFSRIIVLTILGKLVKYGAIIGFYFLVT